MLLAKLYARIVGIAFILVVFSLIADLRTYGVRPETIHKIFHVAVGLAVVRWVWDRPDRWRPFALGNGIFFSVVSVIGWLHPDLGMLDAFNRTDTILHTIVGASGLFVGAWSYRRIDSAEWSHTIESS